MTAAQKHYYAKDYASGEMVVSAFTSKTARDGFVEDGNRRFAMGAKEADTACMKLMGCSARTAAARGFI